MDNQDMISTIEIVYKETKLMRKCCCLLLTIILLFTSCSTPKDCYFDQTINGYVHCKIIAIISRTYPIGVKNNKLLVFKDPALQTVEKELPFEGTYVDSQLILRERNVNGIYIKKVPAELLILLTRIKDEYYMSFYGMNYDYPHNNEPYKDIKLLLSKKVQGSKIAYIYDSKDTLNDFQVALQDDLNIYAYDYNINRLYLHKLSKPSIFQSFSLYSETLISLEEEAFNLWRIDRDKLTFIKKQPLLYSDGISSYMIDNNISSDFEYPSTLTISICDNKHIYEIDTSGDFSQYYANVTGQGRNNKLFPTKEGINQFDKLIYKIDDSQCEILSTSHVVPNTEVFVLNNNNTIDNSSNIIVLYGNDFIQPPSIPSTFRLLKFVSLKDKVVFAYASYENKKIYIFSDTKVYIIDVRNMLENPNYVTIP